MIQIVILSLIVIGLVAWRRGKLDQHGKLMGVATVLGIGSILFVMIPVFTSSLGDFLNDLPSGSLRAQINILHGVIGIVGVSLAGVVTGRWASGKFRVGKSCYSKNLMRATVAVWVFALVLGIGVYLAHVLAWM
ncbi:MAG: hypothetical protein LUQ55_04945 [Methanomassiliicoccales archaeon]|nr:hypothetical protein [Methanomassiliicoccales archaeon]